MTYDELCKLENDTYRENPDIRIRTLANDLGVSFDVAWECLGFRDYGVTVCRILPICRIPA